MTDLSVGSKYFSHKANVKSYPLGSKQVTYMRTSVLVVLQGKIDTRLPERRTNRWMDQQKDGPILHVIYSSFAERKTERRTNRKTQMMKVFCGITPAKFKNVIWKVTRPQRAKLSSAKT